MTDWRTALLDAARRDEQDQLSADEAEAMRRLIVAAAGQAEAPLRSTWLRPVFVVATLAGVIAIGTVAIKFDSSTRIGPSTSAIPPAVTSDGSDTAGQATSADTPNRQLQFLTPGGTRIIWVFNSDLDLKATIR